MANVYFKRGAQSWIDSQLSSLEQNNALTPFVEGAFYLTNDTNRLYFAQANNKLVNLNQYIQLWSSSVLPTTATVSHLKKGDIYYLENDNILAIYDDNNSWTQLNPDTYLVHSTSAVTVSSSTTDTAVITTRVSDTRSTTDNFATGNFSLIAGDNLHFTIDGNAITLDADNDTTNTTYTLGAGVASGTAVVSLKTDNSTSHTDVAFVGDGTISVSADTANNVITITDAPEIVGAQFNAIDANGKISFQILRDSTYGLTNVQSTSGYDIQPIIAYGYNNSTSANTATAVFVNGTASLPVYTSAQVDSLIETKMSQMDAMKYAGVVTSSSTTASLISAPIYGVGTVWKAGEDLGTITLPNNQTITVNVGDLIIAGGSDDTNVTWEVIPSGDDQILRFEGSTIATGNPGGAVTVFDNANGQTNASIARMEIRSDTSTATKAAINVAVSTTSTSGFTNNNTTFTLSHGDAGTGTAVSSVSTTTQTTDTSITLNVITGLSKDANGHITSVTAQTYVLTDTHATIGSVTNTITSTASGAIIGTAVSTDGGLDTKTGSYSLLSDSLKITSNSATTAININIEWESFS